MSDARPLVLHIVYRFDTGGLENGVVNLINRMGDFRHAVLALTEVTEFRRRIERDDVQFISLHKQPGHGFWLYPQLYRVFRQLRPDIVHSRNLAALEAVVPAWLARVPVRIHGEHGRDVGDLDGSNKALQRVRRFYRPFVHRYIALSRDLARYLHDAVQVAEADISLACNGVDMVRFAPAAAGPAAIAGCPFEPQRHWLVGTVGRMAQVKDQLLLTRAFIAVIEQRPALRDRLRLLLVGEGPLRTQCAALLDAAGLLELAWLPGERSDVPDIMRGLHCFVLPSLAEGISNTILEAMASGLPVLATRVGGNAELIQAEAGGPEPKTGLLVPAGDVAALSQALLSLAPDTPQAAEAAREMGRQGRLRVERQFSLEAMVDIYRAVYREQLQIRGRSPGITGN